MHTIIKYNVTKGIRKEITMTQAIKALQPHYVPEQIKNSLLSGSILHDNQCAYKLKPAI